MCGSTGEDGWCQAELHPSQWSLGALEVLSGQRWGPEEAGCVVSFQPCSCPTSQFSLS